MKSRFLLIIIYVAFLFATNLFAQSSLGKDEPMVWYQIFPERFRDGLSSNNPKIYEISGQPKGWEISPWTKDWYSFADWEKSLSPNFYDFATKRRYGGDLIGVLEKLDYLDSLGINVIYFNPIFDARSMHKYDASYYHHIDKYFGTSPEDDSNLMKAENPVDSQTWKFTSADSVFLKLIQEAHRKGIKIVLDGVFNHTGPEFWAFKDIIKNGNKSLYKNWYKIKAWDNPETPENEFDYEGWWGYKGLPEFNQKDENLVSEVKRHIFEISKRWMDPNQDGDPSDGIDGWRLDVAEELGMNFWLDWHQYIRTINPKVFTIAEIWDIKAKNYVSDSTFSGVMNYPLTRLIHGYFINQSIDSKSFVDSVNTLNNNYSETANKFNLNIIDSHDTERILSAIVNRKNVFKENTKLQDDKNSSYKVDAPNPADIEKLKQILVFQFMQPGIPHIYYGNEVGMWGADDPDDRKPMIWADLVFDDEVSHPYKKNRNPDKVQVNSDLFSFYQKMIEIRKKHLIFQNGDYSIRFQNDLIQITWDSPMYSIIAIFASKPTFISLDYVRENAKKGKTFDLLSNKIIKENLHLDLNSYSLIKIIHADR